MEELWIDPRPTWGFPAATLGLAEGVAFSRSGDDGVKFVPPAGEFLAAVNLKGDTVTISRRGWLRDDGALLAVTNHGGGTVTVYAHSVAFSPGGTHLAVSDAGARAVSVYRPAALAQRA